MPSEWGNVPEEARYQHHSDLGSPSSIQYSGLKAAQCWSSDAAWEGDPPEMSQPGDTACIRTA